jgi:hypothetical protein
MFPPYLKAGERIVSKSPRDQADKCRQHADNIWDAQTREELRKLAAVYVGRAVLIEEQEQLC